MSDSAIIGHSVKRVDLLGKVTGAAQYAGDIQLPGMLHARTLRCKVAHANIPVSYTHLDVYKRQAICDARPPM